MSVAPRVAGRFPRREPAASCQGAKDERRKRAVGVEKEAQDRMIVPANLSVVTDRSQSLALVLAHSIL